jgi:hypothetical protein
MTNGRPITLWIIRRGSGRAQVHPSPVHAHPGEVLHFKNWTESAATVHFPAGIAPLKERVIPPGAEADFQVATDAPPRFLEYDVFFGDPARYAEGNSKPGVIVDA